MKISYYSSYFVSCRKVFVRFYDTQNQIYAWFDKRGDSDYQ